MFPTIEQAKALAATLGYTAYTLKFVSYNLSKLEIYHADYIGNPDEKIYYIGLVSGNSKNYDLRFWFGLDDWNGQRFSNNGGASGFAQFPVAFSAAQVYDAPGVSWFPDEAFWFSFTGYEITPVNI